MDTQDLRRLNAELTRAYIEQDRPYIHALMRERKTRAVKRAVKVLVLGDDGVGKSSLICTLISNHFSENEMPDVYANVSIPENAVWDNQVQVTIIDSSQLLSNEEMTQKILEADSIVLVYDVERRETLDHLMTYWLPQRIVPLTRAPVIVAGNKVDARSDFLDHRDGADYYASGAASSQGANDAYFGAESSEGIGDGGKEPERRREVEVQPLLEKFRENIWACYECSAKNQNGVIDVFYMAQHVVVHPIAPIYDLVRNELTPKCAAVMKRIFRFFDSDCDGMLSQAELNRFQVFCFDVALDEEEMISLRKVIMKETPGAGVVHSSDYGPGVTLAGFLSIFKLFINKHKFEMPWMVLRLFGYDDNLDLAKETVEQLSIPPPYIPSQQVCELSPAAESFLVVLFRQYSTPLNHTATAETTGDSRFLDRQSSTNYDIVGSTMHNAVLDNAALQLVFEAVPVAEPGRTPWDASVNWTDHWTTPWVPNATVLPLRLSEFNGHGGFGVSTSNLLDPRIGVVVSSGSGSNSVGGGGNSSDTNSDVASSSIMLEVSATSTFDAELDRPNAALSSAIAPSSVGSASNSDRSLSTPRTRSVSPTNLIGGNVLNSTAGIPAPLTAASAATSCSNVSQPHQVQSQHDEMHHDDDHDDFSFGSLLQKSMTLTDWLAAWRMTATLNPSVAIRYLHYLGYNDLYDDRPAHRGVFFPALEVTEPMSCTTAIPMRHARLHSSCSASRSMSKAEGGSVVQEDSSKMISPTSSYTTTAQRISRNNGEERGYRLSSSSIAAPRTMSDVSSSAIRHCYFSSSKANRAVVQTLVFGSAGCGKTMLLRRLCGPSSAPLPSASLDRLRPWSGVTTVSIPLAGSSSSTSSSSSLSSTTTSAGTRITSSIPESSLRATSSLPTPSILPSPSPPSLSLSPSSATLSGTTTTSSSSSSSSSSAGSSNRFDKVLVLTEVPSNMAAQVARQQLEHLYCCDVALLVFDPTSQESLSFALDIEANLPPTMPRMFVGTKEDICPMPLPVSESASSIEDIGEFTPPSKTSPSLLRFAVGSDLSAPSQQAQPKDCDSLSSEPWLEACKHCEYEQLPLPVTTSALVNRNNVDGGPGSISERIVRIALDPSIRGIPFSRSRLEKQQQRRFWLRVFCTSAFIAATGVAAWKLYKTRQQLVATPGSIPRAAK